MRGVLQVRIAWSRQHFRHGHVVVADARGDDCRKLVS